MVSGGMGSNASAQSPEQMIAKTYKSVQANAPSAQSDLAQLIVNLRKSHTMSEQAELIEALRAIGDVNGASTPAIKAYLKDVVPLALLDIIANRSVEGRVRGQALLALRSFDPSDEVLDSAIASARADTSADRDFVRQQGDILSQWKQDRQKGEAAPGDKAQSVAPEAQKKAQAYLSKRKLEVSSHTLLSAVSDFDTQLIDMLVDAGLKLDGVHAASAEEGVVAGMNSACRDGKATPDKVSAVFRTLQNRGYKMDFRDENGNELVMSTMQSCPAPILARLIDLGARPNPVNRQNATPLMLAFVSGEWDIAKVLIDHGAGMSKAEVDTTFIELPEDPKQKELVNQALKNAGK